MQTKFCVCPKCASLYMDIVSENDTAFCECGNAMDFISRENFLSLRKTEIFRSCGESCTSARMDFSDGELRSFCTSLKNIIAFFEARKDSRIILQVLRQDLIRFEDYLRSRGCNI